MHLLARLLVPAVLATAAFAATAQQQHRIDFVHMGGNDCPPCVWWRQNELPRLQAMPEYQRLHFHYVTKTIHSPVPPAFFFPADARHLQPVLAEASNGTKGSPHQALLVDGKVVDYWFGTGAGKGNADEIARLVRAIEKGEPLGRETCLKLRTASKCKVRGPA